VNFEVTYMFESSLTQLDFFTIQPCVALHQAEMFQRRMLPNHFVAVLRSLSPPNGFSLSGTASARAESTKFPRQPADDSHHDRRQSFS